MDSREYKLSYQLEEHHWWYWGQRNLMVKFFRKYYPKKTNLRILDVGSGTGINLSTLEEFGFVYGMDISEQAASYCRKRGHSIVNGNVMDLPFLVDTFDVVTSLGVFYHKNVSDDLRALSEICRVLKPDGRLFFFDCAMSSLFGNHDIVYHGTRRYTKRELNYKLVQAGFQVDWISYMNVVLFPITWVKRKTEKIIHAKPRKSEVYPTNHLANFLLRILCRAESLVALFINYPFGINIVAHAKTIKPK